jgi:hypothetical protein
LRVKAGTGKIPFPRTCVKAKHFVLRQGEEFLRTYFVGTSTAAHTFCQQCGVHLLYAPHPKSSMLFLNVDCLQAGSFKRKNIEEDDDDHDHDHESDVNNYRHSHSRSHHQERKSDYEYQEESNALRPSQRPNLPASPIAHFPERPGKMVYNVAPTPSESWNLVEPKDFQVPDDISEPTIPADLVSVADSVGDFSIRSSRSVMTTASARDLRVYMSKHLRHQKQPQSSRSMVMGSGVQEEDELVGDD